MTSEEFLTEYSKLAHAIQTGIKLEFRHKYPGFSVATINSLKHLRVGIDTQKSDLGSVGRLLIKKGVFTEQEYFEAILEGLQQELDRYVDIVRDMLGTQNVSLG